MNFFKGLTGIALGLVLAFSPAVTPLARVHADTNIKSDATYWQSVGSALLPLVSTWTVGSVGVPIANLYATAATIGTLTVSVAVSTSLGAGSVYYEGAGGVIAGDPSNFFWNSTANAQYLKIRAGTSPGQWRLYEGSAGGTNYAGIKAAATLAADLLWELPGVDSTGTQYLKSNGSQVLSWGTPTSDVAAAFVSATLDTGQGANELYDMDQNVLTTSDVTFNSVAGSTMLDPTPNSDLTGNGEKSSVTVDANATGIGACLVLSADGHYDEADADATTTMPCSAIALETSTGTKIVLTHGYVRNDAWNWTVGGESGFIYVSNTTGGLTQTAPVGAGDQVQIVGIAISPDIIFAFFDLSIVEI